MILWSLNHDFQIISDKLKKVKNVMIVIARLHIPAFLRQSLCTFPQPIKDGIIGLDWVKQVWNPAKTPQYKL